MTQAESGDRRIPASDGRGYASGAPTCTGPRGTRRRGGERVLARGIDTAAHLATIEAGGRTIAVIGTPINQSYPRASAALQQEIARRHGLVTQFPADYPTRPANFPMRNRTMSLICDATVIVEGGEKSDSISQGWEALRLGRALFLMASILDRTDLR